MTKTLKIMLTMLIVLIFVSGCASLKFEPDKKMNALLSLSDSNTYGNLEADVEDNFAQLIFDDFEGTKTLFNLERIERATITIYYVVRDGDFQVYLIDPYDNIKPLYETTTINCMDGNYRIKVLGTHATGIVSINVSAYEGSTVVPY